MARAPPLSAAPLAAALRRILGRSSAGSHGAPLRPAAPAPGRAHQRLLSAGGAETCDTRDWSDRGDAGTTAAAAHMTTAASQGEVSGQASPATSTPQPAEP